MDTKKQETILVSFVLDETGSMMSCYEATISGFNEYVKTLQKDPNGKFILTTFNSAKFTSTEATSIVDVKPLTPDTYHPDALTPLYDAIGKAIREIEAKKVVADKYLMVILTDGEENASKEYTREKVFDLIKEKEKLGNWTFAFLGANQDSWKVGHSIGLAKGSTMDFNTKNMKATMSSLGSQTMAFRASGQSSTKQFFNSR